MSSSLSILLLSFIPFIVCETWTLNTDFSIDYSVSGDKLVLGFTLNNGKSGWMGLCFNQFMYPADCIICQYNNNRGECFDSYNPGVTGVPFYPAPIVDTYSSSTAFSFNVAGNHGKDNLEGVSGTNANNQIKISLSRKLNTLDKYDKEIICGNKYHIIAAYHNTQTWNSVAASAQTKHTFTGKKTNVVFCSGTLLNSIVAMIGILLIAFIGL